MAQRAQRLLEAAKRPLPEGTFVVGIGLAVSGLTAYGFQIIAFRALSKGDYTALNGLWVVAYVLAPGVSAVTLVDQVRAHCEQRLARFKVPSRIEVVDELPKTVTGKVQKGRLRGMERRRALGILE